VFAAAYERGEGVSPRELTEPAALAPQALVGILDDARVAAVAPVTSWLVVGDGAVRYRAEVEALDADLPPEDSPLHRVSAGAVCRLGAAGGAAGLGIVPDYRRRPDAELALQSAPGTAKSLA
jgi:tRNA threonylcarbamoyladenosine biosynthesis protein TsaB